MRPPKILPWLARQAHLPLDHVEAIWRTSVRECDARNPRLIRDSAHWQRLMSIVRQRIHLAEALDRVAPLVFATLRPRLRIVSSTQAGTERRLGGTLSSLNPPQLFLVSCPPQTLGPAYA